MGGPTITWKSGRVDETDPISVTPDGRLPNADIGPPGADPSDADHLRTIFNRMGFNDQEIVALSGARKSQTFYSIYSMLPHFLLSGIIGLIVFFLFDFFNSLFFDRCSGAVPHDGIWI
jgi:hypothetical protein